MKLLLLITGTLFLASGCSSTVTLGPKANESEVIGASAGTDGANVTVPLLSVEVGRDSDE